MAGDQLTPHMTLLPQGYVKIGLQHEPVNKRMRTILASHRDLAQSTACDGDGSPKAVR